MVICVCLHLACSAALFLYATAGSRHDMQAAARAGRLLPAQRCGCKGGRACQSLPAVLLLWLRVIAACCAAEGTARRCCLLCCCCGRFDASRCALPLRVVRWCG